MRIYKDNRGIAAMITIVVVGVAALIMAYSASFLGLGELDMGYTAQKGTQSFVLADGCIEEALYRLKLDNTYTGDTLSIDENSCIITVSGAGSNRTVSATATVGDFTRDISADVTITGGVVTIDSWND